ncbi:MAG TPA: CBS domain-containing protein [Polyangiales bacterium]|jgi:CBS domain-containing protein|nr:CBS domain-containing protein [Polyangiales bacterium]
MNPAREISIRDFMVVNPVVLAPDTDLLDAVRVLVDRRISGAPVVDERGNLVGVLTEGDFLKAALVAGYQGERGGRVAEYMTREVEAVHANDSLLDVAMRFVETKYRRFPVVEDNRLVGIVGRRDVLRAIIESLRSGW